MRCVVSIVSDQPDFIGRFYASNCFGEMRLTSKCGRILVIEGAVDTILAYNKRYTTTIGLGE